QPISLIYRPTTARAAGISQHGFRQNRNSSKVSRLGAGHRIHTGTGRDSHRPDQLSQRPLPRPQEGSSQPARLAEDGRTPSSLAELHEAHRRRGLPASRPGTRTPVLIEMEHTHRAGAIYAARAFAFL